MVPAWHSTGYQGFRLGILQGTYIKNPEYFVNHAKKTSSLGGLKADVLNFVKGLLPSSFLSSLFISAKISKTIKPKCTRMCQQQLSLSEEICEIPKWLGVSTALCLQEQSCCWGSSGGGRLEVDEEESKSGISWAALRHGHHLGWRRIQMPVPEIKLFKNGLSWSLAIGLEF